MSIFIKTRVRDKQSVSRRNKCKKTFNINKKQLTRKRFSTKIKNIFKFNQGDTNDKGWSLWLRQYCKGC